MSGNAKARSIRCTSCGAPLALHGGGHKILTLNCNYCGAVMDAQQEYAVLAQFKNQPKPDCPLAIGMQGNIKGVAFTIIGMVGRFAETAWVELLLYSPTHGYAWLSYENGHYTFDRRTRTCLGSQLWTQTTKGRVECGEQTFRLYERYEAEITYLAGELTWVAKIGDRSSIAEAIAPPLLLAAERTNDETELYWCEYLTPEAVFRSFNLTDKPAPRIGIHIAQPFHAPWLKMLSIVSKPFALIALVAVLGIWLFLSGHPVYQKSVYINPQTAASQTAEFTITQPTRLVELSIDTELSNAWLYFEVTLLHNGQEIYSIGKEVSYYEGYEDGESWSEGSKSATALIKVPEAGKYSLQIQTPEGGTGESGTIPPNSTITLEVREGFVGKRYFFILLLLAGSGAFAYPCGRWLFDARRWQAVTADNSDDEDDD